MTKPIYEEHTTDMGNKNIKRTDADGSIWWIPAVESNSDYQAYLNKDKPEVIDETAAE
jgi:hypothetical protein